MQTKSGKALHPIGIGTWMIASTFTFDPADLYKGTRPSTANEPAEIEAIRYSLSKGQNHLDCAQLYGRFYTDKVIGKALVGAPREDLYIADKLWKDSVATGKVRPTVEKMLEKLSTDYLDLLYLHDSWEDAPWREALPQIDELIDGRIVRGLGVSNFTVSQMQEVMTLSKHPIVANQVKYNVLYKDQVTQEFKDFCAENAIQVVAYQPIKRTEVLEDETIQRIAAEHSTTASQVALAWLISKGTLPIPKAIQKAHIDENLGAIDLVLSADAIEQLDKL